jgi:hypothetical protein
MKIDQQVIAEFEDALDPAFPEKSGIVPETLGYGEISTTFSISSMPDVALKRMPPFANPDQIAAYKRAVHEYISLLADSCGIRVADVQLFDFQNRFREFILYVAQPRFDGAAIGHNILKSGTRDDLEEIILPVMENLLRVFEFNRQNAPHLSIGLDGQLSNWSFVKDQDTRMPVYFDITTPLFRKNGIEQLDTDIFLQSCPSFLVWLVKWQFLDEVLERYYDLRFVLIDLAANFYKEGRNDLIDDALLIINFRLKKENLASKIPFLEKSEINRYYKNDAFIWKLFLSIRRFDRYVKTKIFRRRYNFILPGRISR